MGQGDLQEKLIDNEINIKKEEEMTGLAKMYGSGMLAVNPPYGLNEKMAESIPLIEKSLR